MEKETKNLHLNVTIATAVAVIITVISSTWIVATKFTTVESKLNEVAKIVPVVMNNQVDLIQLLALHQLKVTR